MTTITEKTTTTTSEKSSMDVVKEQASHVADEMGKAAHQIGETPAAKKVAETGKNAQAKGELNGSTWLQRNGN